jgi:uncharacterized membrane protein YcaP (DUF421 family)
MGACDFVGTIAVGAGVGSTALGTASLLAGVVALGILLALQVAIAGGRRHLGLGRVVDNAPLLLMDGDAILRGNLNRARMTVEELNGKLREANVLNYGQVRAVVLETTGDVSVLHGDGDLDPDLLRDVRGVDRIADGG